MSRHRGTAALRRAAGAAVIVLGSVVGPVTVSVALATDSVASPPPPTDPASLASNPFIPDVNIGDCVSSLPRPDCGSKAQSGYHQYLTLIVLFLATAFIGWRIARGVRSRDKAANAPPPPKTPASKV